MRGCIGKEFGERNEQVVKDTEVSHVYNPFSLRLRANTLRDIYVNGQGNALTLVGTHKLMRCI